MKSPKKALTFLLLMVCLGSIKAQWIQVADFPSVERDDLIAFTCQNRAFAGSGMQVGYQVTKDFYEYKSDLNQWIAVASLPGVARQHSFSFSFDEYACVYAGLSQSGADLKDGYLYEPNSNTWNNISPYPGLGSRSCAAATIGKMGYAGLGRSNNQTMHSDWWQYNSENNIWTQKASFPGLARNLAASFESNGFIYVLGGIDENELAIGDIWQYDPVNDSWLALAIGLAQPIGSTAFCKVKYSGVMVSGYDGQSYYTDNALVFDGFNLAINNIPSIPNDGQRKGAKAFSLNDELYVTCGITSNNVRLKSTWKYHQINKAVNLDDISEAIRVYPNPAKEGFHLLFKVEHENKFSNYSIFNLDGIEILKGNILPQSQPMSIDIKGLCAGSYLLKIYSLNQVFVQKLIVTH